MRCATPAILSTQGGAVIYASFQGQHSFPVGRGVRRLDVEGSVVRSEDLGDVQCPHDSLIGSATQNQSERGRRTERRRETELEMSRERRVRGKDEPR